MTNLPNCLDCKYGEQGHPCRLPDGRYDAAKVARALVQHGRAFDRLREIHDQDMADQHAWAFDCAYDVSMEHPQLVIALAVAVMDACETAGDAARISASLLEDALVAHGPALIGDLELLAKDSPKVRYFLSGIWGEQHVDPDVWRRVAEVISDSGRMDSDGRTPYAAGRVVHVLAEDEARRVLQERVTPLAQRLGLA